jgi:hypothetical protein
MFITGKTLKVRNIKRVTKLIQKKYDSVVQMYQNNSNELFVEIKSGWKTAKC